MSRELSGFDRYIIAHILPRCKRAIYISFTYAIRIGAGSSIASSSDLQKIFMIPTSLEEYVNTKFKRFFLEENMMRIFICYTSEKWIKSYSFFRYKKYKM